MKTPLDDAITIAGSEQALGRLIGASQQRINYWRRVRKGVVPAEFVLRIEEATGINRDTLRPDIHTGA